jgi:hypothetical protein
MRDMEIALLVFLLVVGPLALLGGRDSRVDDVERRRHYQG